MRIMVSDNGIQLGSVFKLVWVSYVVGTSVPIIPVALLAAVMELTVGGTKTGIEIILMLLIVPLVLVGQGLVIGLIVMFGLAVFRKFARIEIRRADGSRRVLADT